MNCYNHPDSPATAYCRSCGRPLCALCQRTSEGVIYCAEHVPVTASASAAAEPPPVSGTSQGAAGHATPDTSFWSTPPPPPPPPGSSASGDAGNPYVAPAVPAIAHPGVSPGLAFLLGLIPGVGAIYNGQYVKGLVHAAIFGLLVTIAQNGGPNPMTGIFVAAFYLYMPFEAYHTARKRQLGLAVEEWSSLMGRAPSSPVPVGPVVLILIGVLFLLNSLDLLDIRAVVRFWPVLLIVGGIGMLFSRLRSSAPTHPDHVSTKFGRAATSEAGRER